jgi:fatty-acyl-CoA synthase
MLGNPLSLVDIINAFEACDNVVTFLDARGATDVRYSELYQLIQAEAVKYRAMGVASGQRVVMALDSSQRTVVHFLALLLMGAVPVSIKPTIPYGDYANYVRQILQQQNARAYLPAQAEKPALVDCARPATASIDALPQSGRIAFVQYTSGSVAEPRPISLSHDAVIHNITGVNRRYDRSVRDCMLNVIPLCHDMGLVGGLLTSIVELHNLLIVDPKYFVRSPLSVLEFASARNVTTAPLPNFIVRYITRILRHAGKSPRPYFERWASIYVGSEPIRKQMVEEFISIGADFGFVWDG